MNTVKLALSRPITTQSSYKLSYEKCMPGAQFLSLRLKKISNCEIFFCNPKLQHLDRLAK